MSNDEKPQHNHVTRDIKPLGRCPACDLYHDKHIPKAMVERSAYDAVVKERDAWKEVAETRGENYTVIKAQLAEKTERADRHYENYNKSVHEVMCLERALNKAKELLLSSEVKVIEQLEHGE